MIVRTFKHSLFLLMCMVLLLSAGVFVVGADKHDGYKPANSLPWPLLDQFYNKPRPAVWSSMGEYQDFGIGWGHSGFDIRGLFKDKIVVVDDGNVWMVANIMNCYNSANPPTCRLYVLAKDKKYIYYYSHLYMGKESGLTSTTRAKIEKASRKNAKPYSVNPGTDVKQNDILACITNFGGNWDHLHFGIIHYEPQDPSGTIGNFDMINPLTAFKSMPLDDESPTISSPSFYKAGTPETWNPVQVKPSGPCRVVSGDLDIVAEMEDTFYSTNPAPQGIFGGETSFGVYEARYIVRPIKAPKPLIDKTWYRFDRMPLKTPYKPRGANCKTRVTKADFLKASIDADGGACHWADDYTEVLYCDKLSQSNYDSGESYYHILTNSWGQDGSWDTTKYADGFYQVSVEASDLAGNKAAGSTFVYVHNAPGGVNPKTVTPDAYVRDNLSDIGDIPSTLGGRPFWASPDIIVVPKGTKIPTNRNFAGQSRVKSGSTYDVYIRIHNDRCKEIAGVKTKIYSANPALVIDKNKWTPITGKKFVGDNNNPNGVTVPAASARLLGPFTWKPTAAEASFNKGHRCLLVYIDSTADPCFGKAPNIFPDDAAKNNNIAQRNIQVLKGDGSSFCIHNPEKAETGVEICFDCNGFPMHEPGTLVRLNVKFHPDLANAWAGVPGTTLTHDRITDELRLAIHACKLTLPAAMLPGGIPLDASVEIEAGPSVTGTYTVHFSEYVNGKLRGGMSFTVSGKKQRN